MSQWQPKVWTFRRTLALGWLATINILLTIAIQWFIVTRLGVGIDTDALFASLVISQFVLEVIDHSSFAMLVPMLSTLAAEDEQLLRREAWGFFLLTCALFGLIATILYACAPLWVSWLFPGFSREGHELTISLARIQLFVMVFSAGDSVLRAVCYARRKFVRAEAATPIGNFIGFALLIWTLPRYGVMAAAWTSVIRVAMPLVLMFTALGRTKGIIFWSATKREAVRRLRPLVLGSLYYKSNTVVNRFLSSMAPTGGLSLFYLSQQCYPVVNNVLEKAIGIQTTPLLAVEAKARRWDNFRMIYRRRMLWMGLASCAGYLVILVAGQPLLHLVVGHGPVTAENVRLLWWLLVALGGSFIAGALSLVTFSAFCAIGNTRTPAKIGMLMTTFSIPAKAVGFFLYGLIGLAVATSISVIIGLLLQLLLLKKSMPSSAPLPAFGHVEVEEV